MKTRVLIVDDETPIQRFLRPALQASGYETLTAETGAQALRVMATSAPDIVVLDLGLPDMDGKEVLFEARKFCKCPIVILSARDQEAEKIAALDLGADDYVEKPFAIGEFLARLRTALRHAAPDQAKTNVYRAEGLAVDLDLRRVVKNGHVLKLTPKEFDLLTILVRHAGRVVTHRQILSAVWGPAHADDMQYLRVFVGQLRAKIEPNPETPRLILTEPGIGYRLWAPDA
ncbi:response regulator [Rhodoblastus acidophilus]|uniref:Response regulator n=1 Tax=Candidatus Rhodoblastus alkanivorans TaxID=2954117 RepID=A0ABS9Z9I5_9HYPH|nr:response regulator [Candidatus Rhodoblastus alkanivorans]MCI4680022.1 response regulator [Candidatus Rhodoblastus alkanivorans]MCI4684236.1 response regulator [Candidatus Rhodoblastus alkanivorans]MDI4641556.1 response regulator [Rhodoblastus acidophilus]